MQNFAGLIRFFYAATVKAAFYCARLHVPSCRKSARRPPQAALIRQLPQVPPSGCRFLGCHQAVAYLILSRTDESFCGAAPHSEGTRESRAKESVKMFRKFHGCSRSTAFPVEICRRNKSSRIRRTVGRRMSRTRRRISRRMMPST